MGVDRLVAGDAALGDDLVAVVAELRLRQVGADLDGHVHVVRELGEDVDRRAVRDGHDAHDVRRAEVGGEVELLREHRPQVRAARRERGEAERRDAFERPVLRHLLELDDLALHAPGEKRRRPHAAVTVLERDLAFRGPVLLAQEVEPLVHFPDVHLLCCPFWL